MRSDRGITEPCETGCGTQLPAPVEHTAQRCWTLRDLQDRAERGILDSTVQVALEEGDDEPCYVVQVEWFDNDGHAAQPVVRRANESVMHAGSVDRQVFVRDLWQAVCGAAAELYDERFTSSEGAS